MKYLLCLFVLLSPAIQAETTDSTVESTADSSVFSAFVPQGWVLVQSAVGDLNKDQQPDAVLVIQQQDQANIIANDGLGMPELNLNPRRLLVLLHSESGYRQVLATEHFLPTEHDEHTPCLADPIEEGGGVGISRGLLTVNLTYWLSCGSYSVSSYQFKFRYDDERFRMIGLDTDHFSRSSGEQYQTSINYLTGKVKRTTGLNMFDESKPKISWDTLAADKRRFYLDEMNAGCSDENGNRQQWCS